MEDDNGGQHFMAAGRNTEHYGGARPKTKRIFMEGRPTFGSDRLSRPPDRQRGSHQERKLGNPDGADTRSSGRKLVKPLTVQEMKALLLEDPDTVLLRIASSHNGFMRSIQSCEYNLTMMKMALSVIDKASTVASSKQHLATFLAQLLRIHFLEGPVRKFLSKVDFADHSDRETTGHIVNLVKKLLTMLPTHSLPVAGIIVAIVGSAIDMFKSSSGTSASGQSYHDFETLKIQYMDMKAIYEETASQAHRREFVSEKFVVEPSEAPDDFRELPIIPVARDMNIYIPPFLRRNKLHEDYASVHHYLDIQYRLFREDMISPLRNAIHEVQQDEEGIISRVQDGYVYRGVQIHEVAQPYHVDRKNIAYRLTFTYQNLENISWEITKRFKYGTLLCLSSDNFQTLLFGTVACSNPRDLAQGRTYVHLEPSSIPLLHPRQVFVMIEPSTYFEAYKHNLAALQEMTEETMPFKRYILNGDASVVAPPKYLVREDSKVEFDFGCLMESSDLPQIPGYTPRNNQSHLVPVLQLCRWPKKEDLKLDSSQYNALKSALTKEFSIIQGPPGTGKTYVGLKIVQILLANSRIWMRNAVGNPSPILIVCYTNHALDQFLEGIVQFNGTEGVVRVGGRSIATKEGVHPSEDPLYRCSLRHLRNRPGPDLHPEVQAEKSDCQNMQDQLMAEIYDLSLQMSRLCSGILSDESLKTIISKKHHRCFQHESQSKQAEQSAILDWLLDVHNNAPKEIISRRQTNEADFSSTDAPHSHTADAHDNKKVPMGTGGIDVMQNQMTKKNDENEKFQVEPDKLYQKEDFGEEDDFLEKRKFNKQQAPSRFSGCVNFVVSHLQANETIENLAKVSKKGKTTTPLQNAWRKLKQDKKKLIRTCYQSSAVLSVTEVDGISDVWQLTVTERWKLYRFWVSILFQELQLQLHRQSTLFDEYAQRLREIGDEENLLIMRNAKVVAMTTTGAAKFRGILQRIQPRIILVEEAAEVFEVHIVTALSKACQHLILIGDHQQLRPNPASYKLAREYNLDISMFERMVKNKMYCERLSTQHRMRPQICRLIVPHIYSQLENHHSVMNLQPIKGVGGCVFFLNHHHKEVSSSDGRSHSNEHEADFLIAFARYLVQQGYKSSQITILTLYTGQMFLIKARILNDEKFADMRITPVDRYQGEENDVILLSLVRSNDEGRIGFLKMPNRVCVALSRARKGFYAIGNMDLLRQESKLWNSILVKENDTVVESLPLVCENHPHTRFDVSVAEDFNNAPEGGCTLKCDYRLTCGHVCTRFCHHDDKTHEFFKCVKPCARMHCTLKHACTEPCCSKCSDERKCTVKIDKVIPQCKHTQRVPCHMDPGEFLCQALCEKTLPCQHRCTKICSATSCTTPSQCNVIVPDRVWPCGHQLYKPCRQGPDTFPCDVMITKELPCTHVVKMKCSEDVAKHSCRVKVTLKLKCGHSRTMACSDAYRNAHLYGGQIHCVKKIVIQCKYEGNHRYPMPCPNAENAICPLSCTSVLPCGHTCPGTCGECRRSKCHKACVRNCNRKLICGHMCRGMCGDSCPPCQERFLVACGHGSKSIVCNENFPTCIKPCRWKCKHHLKCTAQCWEVCNRTPCRSPCPQKLSCGHLCVGFCGEPCIPNCLECHEKFFNQIAYRLKTNIQKTSRFVMLQPCGHIVEVNVMRKYVQNLNFQYKDITEVILVRCPFCQSIVTYCPRFNDCIKQNIDSFTMVRNYINQHKHRYNNVDVLALKMSNFSVAQRIFAQVEDSSALSPWAYRDLQKLSKCVKVNGEIHLLIKDLDERGYPPRNADDSLPSIDILNATHEFVTSLLDDVLSRKIHVDEVVNLLTKELLILLMAQEYCNDVNMIKSLPGIKQKVNGTCIHLRNTIKQLFLCNDTGEALDVTLSDVVNDLQSKHTTFTKLQQELACRFDVNQDIMSGLVFFKCSKKHAIICMKGTPLKRVDCSNCQDEEDISNLQSVEQVQADLETLSLG